MTQVDQLISRDTHPDTLLLECLNEAVVGVIGPRHTRRRDGESGQNGWYCSHLNLVIAARRTFLTVLFMVLLYSGGASSGGSKPFLRRR
jgi:hypothetical protein